MTSSPEQDCYLVTAKLAKTVGDALSQAGLSCKFETICLQLVHLFTLRTKDQFVTGLLSMASSHFDGKLLEMICGAAKSLFVHTPTEQAGAAQSLRSGFDFFLDNLRAVKSNELTLRLRRIIALCVAGGFGASFAKKYPLFFKRCCADDEVKSYDAVDIMEETLYAVRAVWDVMQDCIVEQSFSPLFGRKQSVVA